jgi:hypothetical protein
MTEPVVTDSSALVSSKYFNKSKSLYRYSAYIFLWIIGYTQIGQAIGLGDGIMNAVFVGIPALSLYIITPLGIFYAIKSYISKEPYYKYRAFYLFGHLFFLFILLAALLSLYSDIVRYAK